MKLIKGDIWKFHDAGEWICVTTNGFVKANGCAVMGRGIALQCKRRYPQAEVALGRFIQRNGNIVGLFMPSVATKKILCFPTKHNWWEKSDLELIKRSCRQLRFMFLEWELSKNERVYLPKPGCSNGRLEWKDVEKAIRPILDDRFVVVEYDPETV